MWPVLRRKKVTVWLALTAAPITAPVVPLTPLGRSTAITGAPLAFIASIMARGRPSTSRSSPAPNSASTTMSQSVSETGEACSTGPLQRSAASAASPFSRAALADEADADRIAALGQMPRRDKAVAAVIAGPGHDHHAAALQHGADRIGHRAAGILHQLDAGGAAGDGQPVGFGHFGSGEQFDHRFRHYRPAAKADKSIKLAAEKYSAACWQKFMQGA